MSPVADELRLRRKLQVSGKVIFETAWRIGTGKEGQTMSDLGVLLDPHGQPILPGSSLKGKLRSTCESLAHALNLSACLLNFKASGVPCTSDVQFYKDQRKGHKEAVQAGPEEQLSWIAANTCDVCKLFGSPVRASRLRCSDGNLGNPDAVVVQVRDGVVLDRDSHTAVNGLKYDYEVVPAGTTFEVRLDLDNPSAADEALFGAALFEWSAGSSLGGFTSRGLGRFHLEVSGLRGVDFDQAAQRIRYLTSSRPETRLSDLSGWEEYFTGRINAYLEHAPAGR